MPLDRRIRIERNHGVVNEAGELADDWRTFATVWSQKTSSGFSDAETTAGIVVTAVANFTLRYRSGVTDIVPSLLRIVDAAGAIWEVDSVRESDERRRFLEIQAVREVDD